MKDLIACLPLGLNMLAQLPPQQDSYERMGIAAISLGATGFLWRYFVGRENDERIKRDAADAAALAKKDKAEADEKEERKNREAKDMEERNRLLSVANLLQAENVELQKKMVEILVSQDRKSDVVAATLEKARVALEWSNRTAQMRHDDDKRSIKDLARKIPAGRHVIVDNEVLDVKVQNPDDQ